MPNIDVKPVLQAMLAGWCDKNNAPEEERGHNELGQRRPEEHWFLPHCEGDEKVAFLLSLWGLWSNDILCVAADYGITIEMIDRKYQVVEVSPRPSPEHWWCAGEYKWEQDEGREDSGEFVWVKGYWHEALDEPNAKEEEAPLGA